MKNEAVQVLKQVVPASFRNWFSSLKAWPPIGGVIWGSFRRLTPIGPAFGYGRGGNRIGRYYIENFLAKYISDVKGRVLEIADNSYTRKYGGKQVVKSDVLHAVAGNPGATIVGDLSTGKGIPNGVFDCVILTQTLFVIYDVRSAVLNAYSSLKPGGVLLATFCGISQISRYDMDRWGDYWRFTDASAKQIFGEVFGAENVSVRTHGNVMVACAFLHGLAAEELKPSELDYNDPDYQVIITVRAVKPVETLK